MSWSESCSTDSGVRNPSTTATFVATGAGGAAGWATGAGTDDGPAIASESGRTAAVSERPELLGIRSQAAAARTAHSNVSLIGARPPRCVPSRRLGLLQLLFSRLDHPVRHVRRHLLIHVELRPVRPPPVRQRVQCGRVA